jgi:hypothetical protein
MPAHGFEAPVSEDDWGPLYATETVERDNTIAAAGSWSLHVTTPGVDAAEGLYGPRLTALEPGQTIRAVGQITGTGTVVPSWGIGTDFVPAPTPEAMTLTASWAPFSLVHTLVANDPRNPASRSAGFSIVADATEGPQAVEFWVDEVTVEVVPEGAAAEPVASCGLGLSLGIGG